MAQLSRKLRIEDEGNATSLIYTDDDRSVQKIVFDNTGIHFDGDAADSFQTDDITEKTPGHGIAIDTGVLVKDNYIDLTTVYATEVKADHVNESATDHGVVVDGATIKDNTIDVATVYSTEVKADHVNESTTGHGVAILKSINEGTGAIVNLTDSMVGKVFFINADSGATTYILPVPTVGAHYKWIWCGDNASSTIIRTADVTDTTGDVFRGGLFVISADNDTTFVEAAGADTNTLTLDSDLDNAACGIGSWVEVICTEDPTWFIHGVINGNSDADGTGASMFTDTDL
jgi:hypothetical protein